MTPKFRSHPLLTVSSLCAALALAGCDQSGSSATAGGPAGAMTVGIIELKPQTFEKVVELPGRTTAYRIAEVRPQVEGIILERLFEEGGQVERGQPLYQIDPATYKASLKSAKASLAVAQAKADRYKGLVADEAVSKMEYDEANADLLEAQAQLDMASINVEYTKVEAPIGGRIGRSSVTEGALVSSNQANALATIQQLDPIYVDVTQPVKELLSLRKDLASGRLQKIDDDTARVHLMLEDGTLYDHPGELKFSEVTVDEGTASVTLRAVFPNPDEDLLPGMFVRARLLSGVERNAILAPQQGVTRDVRGAAIAYVVSADNKVEKRSLNAEETVGNRWLIRAGLNAGDRLITEGLQKIQPGMPVETVPANNVKSNNVKANTPTPTPAAEQ